MAPANPLAPARACRLLRAGRSFLPHAGRRRLLLLLPVAYFRALFPSQSRRPASTLSGQPPPNQRRPRAAVPPPPSPASSILDLDDPPDPSFSAASHAFPPSAATPSSPSSPPAGLGKILFVVDQSRSRFLSLDGIPDRKVTLVALTTCLRAARAVHPYLVNDLHARPSSPLHLGIGSAAASSSLPTSTVAAAVARVSRAARDIITHPPVVITRELLGLYIDIHAQLRAAATIPAVLALYGAKPLPTVSAATASTITYEPQNPRRAAAAVPADLAERALDAAISARDLDSAVAVAEACYATPAYMRHQLLRDGMRPGMAVAATPPLAYGIAAALGEFQIAVDPSTASGWAFAGIMGYAVLTGGMGVLANMGAAAGVFRRVTWAPGTSYWTRWAGEGQRAALDRVACAWGFRDATRHGEEGGGEWASLREYVMYRSMILDNLEDMDGMG